MLIMMISVLARNRAKGNCADEAFCWSKSLTEDIQAIYLQGHMKNLICFWPPDPMQQLLKVRHQGNTRTCETVKASS